MTAFLAIDTSTSACSVALNINGVISEDFVVAHQNHTQRLLPMVEKILTQSNISLKQLDAIAFSSGPGSFTGLRICLGVVQGLAYGADLPVIGVSTLEIMSATALRTLRPIFDTDKTQKFSEVIIVPALDARMSEIYWSGFSANIFDKSLPEKELSTLFRLMGDKVSSPQELCHPSYEMKDDEMMGKGRAKGGKSGSLVLGIGDGWKVDGINQSIADHIEPSLFPHAFDLAVLAEKYFTEGKTMSAFDAQPTYIRNEVSWAKRKKIRS